MKNREELGERGSMGTVSYTHLDVYKRQGVSRAGQIIIDALQEPFCSQVFHASKDTPIVLASLGNDAGIYGAVRMLLS